MNTKPPANYQDVPLADISIPIGRRVPNEKKVQELAESIKEVGLLQPIGLTTTKRLMFGGHRLAACKLLRWKTIPATIRDLDDLRCELAELDENIIGNRYTAVEEARCFKRRKEIYLLLHPDTKQGGSGRRGSGEGEAIFKSDTLSFSDDTAAKTGKSKRTVERAVKLAEALEQCVSAVQDVGDKLTAADVKILTKLPAHEQDAIADDLQTGAAGSVKESMKVRAIKAPTPKRKTPPKQFDRGSHYKEWNRSIGPVVRLVDKIAKAVGEPNCPAHKTILGQLAPATEEMREWMGM